MRGTRNDPILRLAFSCAGALLFGLAAFSLTSARQPGLPVPAEAIRHNNLGAALMDAGLKDPNYFSEASKEFEAALALAPGYRTARINLGLSQYYGNQDAQALATFEALYRDAADDLHVNFMLGLLYENSGDFSRALPLFEKVTRADPGDAKAWFHLGYCYSGDRRFAESIEPMRKAAALEPYQRQFRYNLFVALRRTGRLEEARQELESFKRLETSSVRSVSPPKSTLDYLRQGRYAEAISDSRASSPGRREDPQYADVSGKLGLRPGGSREPTDTAVARVLSGAPTPSAWFADAANRKRLVAATSGGAAFVDFNNDLRLDLFTVEAGGRQVLYRQEQDGRFTDVTQKVGLGASPAMATGCVWGDFNNDGWVDLAVTAHGEVRLFRNALGEFVDATAASGVAQSVGPSTWVTGAAFADIDHDGDLDLYLTCLVDLSRPAAPGRVRFPADFAAQPGILMRNNLDDTFTDITREANAGGTGPARSVFFSDLNNDRAVDFVLFDLKGNPAAMLNRGDGSFASSGKPVATVPAPPPPGEARAYGDFDGDGDADELAIRAGEAPKLRQRVGRPENWLTVRLVGFAEPGKLKSNRLGIGTTVEVRSVGRWETLQLRAGNGLGGCDAPELYFDLGVEKKLDFVRAVFPSGVRWTLRDVAVNQVLRLEEPLLDVNSCPTVFTWDGDRFHFIADTISAGILGELVRPGEYSTPDPDEWLRIEGELLKPDAGGTLRVRWANPLEEVAYLDSVRLIAVDHPGDVAVFSSEKMVSTPVAEEPVELYGLRSVRPLAGAFDQRGRDVSDTLAAKDRKYPGILTPLPFKGFAEDWTLTLDLGQIEDGDAPVLLIDGWSYWNSSASVIAAAQAGKHLWGPVLEVREAGGSWRTAARDAGVAAGLPRSFTIDLTGRLRRGERTVRLRSNRMLFYDRIRVAARTWTRPIDAVAAHSADVRLTELPISGANLRWLGYPARVLPDGQLPEVFDYNRIQKTADWGLHEGLLTRYGDVSELLERTDDRMAVMEHGEQVALSFGTQGLPEIPAGWRRTYFLYSCGFEKGYELHSAHSATVEPMPFSSKRGYPSGDPRGFDRDPAWLEYFTRWNTRPSFLRQ